MMPDLFSFFWLTLVNEVATIYFVRTTKGSVGIGKAWCGAEWHGMARLGLVSLNGVGPVVRFHGREFWKIRPLTFAHLDPKSMTRTDATLAVAASLATSGWLTPGIAGIVLCSLAGVVVAWLIAGQK